MTTEIAETIRDRFSIYPPIYLAGDADALKFELKPYLQPFEKLLAIRELQALLGENEPIVEEHGYHVVHTDKPEELFLQRLTYWQRVGRSLLMPTVQKTLEFTQNGLAKANEREELHNSRRLRYGPHDIHEYRGKFFPQLVRSLMNIANMPDTGIVLDPMCGSGTTPCEAAAFGHTAIAADMNPLSVLVATVKSRIVRETPGTFSKTVAAQFTGFRFKKVRADDVWVASDLNYLQRWFSLRAIDDLASIVTEIATVPRGLYRNFFRVCLSNIIRSVSWQKDTDLRVRKEPKPYVSGTAISRFRAEVEEQTDRISAYLCVMPRRKAKPSIVVREGNAIFIEDVFREFRGHVDLLVTSPPYATALPYLDTDRLSLVVLGLLSRNEHKDKEALMIGTREVSEKQRRTEWERYQSRKTELPATVSNLIDRLARSNHSSETGFRRRNLPALLGKYYLDMLDAMRSACMLMKNGARGYYVVGNNSTVVGEQKIEIPTDEFLFEIGAMAGWRQDEMIDMELLPSRDIFKENRGSKERILCFRT